MRRWLVCTCALYNLGGDQVVWPGAPAGGQSFSPELGDVDIYAASG